MEQPVFGGWGEDMKAFKRFMGLLKEDLKNKRWMVTAVCYLFGMFCLMFSTKMTIPAGEMRSLYVGAGNTSFFAAMLLLGIIMGAGGFPYLHSEQKSDLYLSLPFSRRQLFAAGCLNNFLIFGIPAVACKILFFRISLSMGYSRYEDSVSSLWSGCLVLLLGFLFVMNLSMLASFLAGNAGYMGGMLALFFFGPGAGLYLTEKMLGIFVPSFYRLETLETLKRYLPPLLLLKNAAGIEEYTDGAYWMLSAHLPYIFYLAVITVLLLLVNLLVFQVRPVEQKGRAFIFRPAEGFVRYSCLTLASLWLVDALQIFSFGSFSPALAGIGVLIGVPLAHGLLNMLITCNAKKFLSAKWRLLAEMLVMILLLGVFSLWGKGEEKLPPKEDVASMAVVLTALGSGDDSSRALHNMKLAGAELSDAYDWVNASRGEGDGAYEVLVKYELKNGREKYFRYQIPWYALDGFEGIFAGEEFKWGSYEGLRLDSMKYYEICWSNGIESYTLDLDEQERMSLWEAYREDLGRLTLKEIRHQPPIGRLTFASVKNQGDVKGYIYPGFTQVLSLLEEYGIDGTKGISDYEITKIVVDKYVLTRGLLYQVNSLEWEKIITDKAAMEEYAGDLYCEEFWEDYQLNEMDTDMVFTVYYRDSDKKTVNHVKCRIKAE